MESGAQWRKAGMGTAKTSDFLRRLTRGMVAETLADQSDRQLVEQFLAGRGEAVFEAILRRHGAMVYRVCWRVLQHHQDAEDAFQATFLVLAQRLRTVRKHASLASWLHGVAHRLALRAKAGAATRRRHEAQASVCQTMPPDDGSWGEVRAVLDAELAALPEKWRLPLVLCYLEGRTQDEAAAQIGWSPRTLRRRLEEARTGLGRRLSRRGVAWSAALSAVLLSDAVASAALAPGLLDSTIKAASLFAAGQTAAAGLVSAKAAALTEGVLKTMFLTKLKTLTAGVFVLAAVGSGGSSLLIPTLAPERAYAARQVVKEKPPTDKKQPQLEIHQLEMHRWTREVDAREQPITAKEMVIHEGRHRIEMGWKKLAGCKNAKEERNTLAEIEADLKRMKDLLQLLNRVDEKSDEEPPADPLSERLKKVDTLESDQHTEPLQILVCFTDSDKDRPSMRFMTASRNEPTPSDISSSELKARGRWRELPPANTTGAALPLTTRDLPKEKLPARHRFDRIVTRDEAIPIIQNYIEVDLKKLKETKDDKSMREALKSLEESVQSMKNLLSFPGVPTEKQSKDKTPEKEKPPPKRGTPADSEEGAKALQLQGTLYDAEEEKRLTLILPPVQTEPLPVVLSPQVPSEPLKVRLPPLQREPLEVILPAHVQKDEPAPKKTKVRRPPPADTTVQLDKIVDRLGLARKLAKINAVNVRDLREQEIRIMELLSYGAPAEKKR